MFLRRFTDFVLQNRVQGMATAFVSAFVPIIGSISILIAGLVTLRKGAFEGLLVLIAATVPYIITYFASPPAPEQALLAEGILGVIIVSNVLTWMFAIVLRRFSNWNITIEIAALLGVLVIVLVHLFNPDIQNWWASQLSVYFAKTTDVVNKLKATTDAAQSAPSEAQIQAVNTAKRFATGFVAVSVLFNALLQLLIARWWQAAIYNPGGLRKELYQIRLSHITGFAFVIALVLAFLGIDVALDMMPILCMAFFVAGLSLLHSIVSKQKIAWLWLILIYMGIIWLFPLSIVIIAFIALVDTGFDFRKRFLL